MHEAFLSFITCADKEVQPHAIPYVYTFWTKLEKNVHGNQSVIERKYES